MPQENIFTELRDQNVFRCPNLITTPEHMRDKKNLCMFHNDYGHNLSACRNLYNQLKAMMEKGQFLKYLKKKVPFGSYEKSWEGQRLT